MKTVVQVLVETNLASSKAEARRLIEQGGIRLNNQKITDKKKELSKDDFDKGGTVILRRGKRKAVNLVLANSKTARSLSMPNFLLPK